MTFRGWKFAVAKQAFLGVTLVAVVVLVGVLSGSNLIVSPVAGPNQGQGMISTNGDRSALPWSQSRALAAESNDGMFHLPAVDPGSQHLYEAIFQRRSQRQFRDEPVSLQDLAGVLWAGVGLTVDGVTGPTRAAPSAGATNPLRLVVCVQDVVGLEPGLYGYEPFDHALIPLAEGRFGAKLAAAALRQTAVADAPVTVIVTADYGATTGRYGERGYRYVYFEAGHAVQNMVLAGETLGLGSVIIGAFEDEKLAGILRTAAGVAQAPLLLLPLGWSR